jgi:hypothetical protein
MSENPTDWSKEQPNMYASGREAAERNMPMAPETIDDLRARAAFVAGYEDYEREHSDN